MKFIDYSIKNTVVVRFLVFLLVIGGIFSYNRLGKLEDPEFKIKEALVITLYPEADAHTVELQVTNKVEEAVNKLANIDFIQSVSKPGYSEVKVKLDEGIPADEVDQYWDNLRKKVNDVKLSLPLGTLPPIVLDDYGSVYGMFLAVTSDGYSYSELKKYTEYITKELNSISGINQVAEFGKVSDAIEVIIDREKLNAMGLNTKIIATSLLSENLISGGGVVDYGDLRVPIRFNNDLKNIEDLENLVLFSKKFPDGSNQIVRLKDVATLKEGYVEPITQKMYFNNKMAMGISLSPEKGTNVVEIGEEIDEKIVELKEKLPVGINIEKVYYQPDLVTTAIDNFVINLIVSVITVVGVLLFTMGVRSGLIIGSGLILSILGTLIFMYAMKIDMQRVSLGSFIIAMGMLVDNSIVIVDGVLVRRSKGMAMEGALKESTYKPAIPLLGATVIAALAFLPGTLMPTYVGEYVSSSFWVIGISLMLSWVLCLTQTPVYCKLYLESGEAKPISKKERAFYKKANRFLYFLLKRRKIVLTILGGVFLGSCLLFLTIPKTFFPDSDKKGFTINMWAPEGSKTEVIEGAAKELREYLLQDSGVVNITTTIGASPSRYYTATIPEMPNPAFAQLILNVERVKDVERVGAKAVEFANENIAGVTVSVKKYPNGVPAQYPIEIAFSGPDPQVLRNLAQEATDIMKTSPRALNVKNNWRNKLLTWEADYSQFKGKRADVTPLDLGMGLMRSGEGMPIGKIKQDDKQVTVLLKEKSGEVKNQLTNIEQTPIWGANLEAQPFSSVIDGGKLAFEEGQVWRRDRVRTITVQCDVPVGVAAESVRDEFRDRIESIELPKGYKMFWLGEAYEQEKNNMAIIKSTPIPAISMFIICVLLFANLKTPILIGMTLPLAIIGIAPGLALTGKSFGFMSIIGVLSLTGMMIKNVIVLMDEINYEIDVLKKDRFTALIDSAVSRIRSVGLAALTTIFGMIPLLWDPLYGDMAATIIFGLFASTMLTLFVFPVIYGTVNKIYPQTRKRK
jgi:multidrug efflux pump subunit AcrB